MLKNQNLLKATCMYLVYFLYTYFAGYLVQLISPENETLILLVLDIIFLIFILIMFRKQLKEDMNYLKEKISFKKILKITVLGVISVFALNIIMGIVSEIIFPNLAMDQNTQAIYELASVSTLYIVFKTMIFGVIAEELLFRESLSKCINNKLIFVLLTAIIYTGMNFIFMPAAGGANLIVELIGYFFPALLFSFIYVKNDRNIILVMLVKFFYNLIPLALLFIA